MSQRSPISLVHPQDQEKSKSYISYSPYRSRFYESSLQTATGGEATDAKAKRNSYREKGQHHQYGGEKERDQEKHINEYVRDYVYKKKHKELKQSKQVQRSILDSKSSVRVVLPHRAEIPRRSGTASTYGSTSTNGSSTSHTIFRPNFPFPFTPAPTPTSAAALASPGLASAIAPATATGTVHAYPYGPEVYSEPPTIPASAPAFSSSFRPASASSVSSYYSCATGDDNIKTPEIFEEFRSKQIQIPENAEDVEPEEYAIYENFTENVTTKIGRKRSGRDINTDIDLELGIVTDNIALDELEKGKRRTSFYPRPLSPLTPLHRGNSNRRISQNHNGRRLRRKDHEVRAREARLKSQFRPNSINDIDISTSSAYRNSHTKTKTQLKSYTSADHGQSIWAFCLGVIAVLTLLFLSSCHRNLGRVLKSPRPPRMGNL